MRGSSRFVLLLALLMCASAAPSSAQVVEPPVTSLAPGASLKVGQGYVLYYKGGMLRVRNGRRSAELRVNGGIAFGGVDVTLDPAGVTVTRFGGCDEESQTFTHLQLEALLVLEEAERLRTTRRHAEAEERFAAALALDETLVDAERGRIRALLALGRTDDAVVALLPRLAHEPLATYIDVATNFALAPLRTRDEIVRIRPAVAGTARIDPTTRELGTAGVAISPAGWLATIESEGGHGACFYSSEVVLRDATTLARLAGIDILHAGDFEGDGCGDDGEEGEVLSPAGRAAMRTRVARANRILAELGFSTPPGAVAGSDPDGPTDARFRARFGASGLGLVVGDDGAARFFRHGRLVAEHPRGTIPGFNTISAIYLPSERRVLLPRMSMGCEWSEHRNLTSLPAPP